jgi:hypothetical protein
MAFPDRPSATVLFRAITGPRWLRVRRDFLDRLPLALTQMRMAFLDFSTCLEAGDGRVLLLPRAHGVDGVAFVADHFARGERAAWRAMR